MIGRSPLSAMVEKRGNCASARGGGGRPYPVPMASSKPNLRIHGDCAPTGAARPLGGVLPAGRSRVRGLYVHVPFCFHKCHYCDFYSFVDREGRSGDYLARLERDIAWARGRIEGEIDTVFVGGGTPTLLTADELRRLTAAIAGLPLARGA